MNNQRFTEIVQGTLQNCADLLISKGDEYATNVDRLHNFKEAAIKRHCSPEEANRGMTVKHTVSIEDIIRDVNNGKLPSLAKLNEKINDEINYLILLKALIMERLDNNINDNPPTKPIIARG